MNKSSAGDLQLDDITTNGLFNVDGMLIAKEDVRGAVVGFDPKETKYIVAFNIKGYGHEAAVYDNEECAIRHVALVKEEIGKYPVGK